MTHRGRHPGEVELKFDLDGRAASKVRHHPLLARPDGRARPQTTVYFDTDNGKVHKEGYSLRVRRVGDDLVQTVKTNGSSAGLFDRGEWETRVKQMAPDPKALKRTPLGGFKKLDRNLAPVVCSEVERTTWLIDCDSSVVEVVLDSGTVSAGDQDRSFHELELELKDGEPAAMFGLAQELSQAVPLQIGVLSKEERGLMLADGAFEREHKAASLDVHKTMDIGQVFSLIVGECIRHFRLNEALIIADRNPDALHQARIAMRRLRTAFSLFRPAIRQASLAPLRTELHGFLLPFGEARNLDVFLDNHKDELGRNDQRKLTAARARAYDQVIDTLKAQRSRDMLLDIVEWTASENWRKQSASAPIGKFAADRLDAAWKKVARRGARLGDLEEHQLHRLRIAIKRLRYSIDFLRPLYAKKRVRKFVTSLAKMQDCLGLVHDDMVSRAVVADLALDETGRTDVTDRSRQIKAMERRFKQVKRIGRFWSS